MLNKNSNSDVNLNECDLLPELNSVWKEYTEKKVSRVQKLQEEGGKSFIFYTDTHANVFQHDKYSSKLIEYARKALGIKTVIFGGDPYSLGQSREEARMLLKRFVDNEFFLVQKETALYAIGNHESNTCFGIRREDMYRVLVPDTDLFSDTVEQTLNYGRKLVFDDKAIRATGKLIYPEIDGFSAKELKMQAVADVKLRYYCDDEENKIRYIIFNTGSMGVSQCALYGGVDRGLGWTGYCMLELGWLIETLESTPDDYSVVVAGHMLTNDFAIGEFDWSVSPSIFTEHINGALTDGVQQDINAILSFYKLGKSGEYTVNFTGKGANDDIYHNIRTMASSADCATLNENSVTFKYDFSKRADIQKNIVFFTGHNHCDRSWISGYDSNSENYISYRCYPNDKFSFDIDGGILGIMTCCDCRDLVKVADKVEMVDGTPTTTVIDIVTIMPNGALHCTRIGAGSDRSFNTYR